MSEDVPHRDGSKLSKTSFSESREKSEIESWGGTQQERLEAIRQLLDMFRLERTVYVIATMVAVLVLITCAVLMLWKRSDKYGEIAGLIGSTGGIAFSTGRLLRMWSDALRMLNPNGKFEQEK